MSFKTIETSALEALKDEEECVLWKEPLPWAVPPDGEQWDGRSYIVRMDEKDRWHEAMRKRGGRAGEREPELARFSLAVINVFQTFAIIRKTWSLNELKQMIEKEYDRLVKENQ